MNISAIVINERAVDVVERSCLVSFEICSRKFVVCLIMIFNPARDQNSHFSKGFGDVARLEARVDITDSLSAENIIFF